MAAVEAHTSSRWFRHEDALITAFATRSHTDGARFGAAIAVLDPAADVDVRASRIRVRLHGSGDETATRAAQIDQLATASGLPAEPEAAREFSLVVETAMPNAVATFWTAVLGYRRSGDLLSDPLRRRPPVLLREADRPPGPRSWLHLDVSRPGGPSAEDAPSLGGRFVGGPFGVCAADAEGNVADIIPSGPCSDDPAVSAWHGGFSALAAWRATSIEHAAGVAVEVAGLADAAGVAVGIDRRGHLVVVDSGKDGWETQSGFPEFAADVQAAATRAGLSAAPAGLGFLQAYLVAESAATVRSFWAQVLGYLEDPRAEVLDIVDPHGLGPVVVFQDVDEPLERGTRDRFHLRLAVPATSAAHVLDAVQTTGGRVRQHLSETWEVTDPEGNALELVAMPEVDLAQPA